MKPPISSQDWETLSAYLDNELEPRARQMVEARLESEPDLSNSLDNLRTTRALLKRAPQARPPHHFTLTREMAAAGGGLFSRFSLSMNALTAVASLLLVVVVLGDILTFGTPSFLPAPGAAASADTAAEPEMMAVPQDEAADAAGAAEATAGDEAEEEDERAMDTDEAAPEEEEPMSEDFAFQADDGQMKEAEAEPRLLSRENFILAELGLALLTMLGLLLGRRSSPS